MRTSLRSQFATCAAILLGLSQTLAAPPGGYYLVWSDEFNGSSLDSSKWGYWSGGYHDAVNTSSAISVSGGNLTITTYTSGGTHYTGIVESRNRFHPRYGFLEARINYDSSAGMWSAFWLQADHEDDCPFQERFLGNPYYAGSEIDICEHRSQDSSGNNVSGGVNAYIHYDGYSGYCQGWGTTVGPSPNPYGSGLGTGFHTYGLLWNSSECQFYIDNTWRYSTSSGVSGTPEWILLSSIVDGASWAGGIPGGGYGSLGSSSTKMIVDYVRYYAPTNQVYWNGGTSIYWTNSANWIAGRSPKPNEEVIFSTLSAADTCNLATNFAIRKIVFLDGGGFTLNGGTLSLGSGGVDVASTGGNVTFNSPVQLTANQNWHVGPDRTLTMAGPLSGTNSFTKDGWSLLVLSGNNSNFTGTINVGTASTGSDDGALRIKSSAAVSNAASPIWIRNNNNGKSRLELDGSSGNLVITKDISIAARNSSASAILNIAGSNMLAGDLILQVGGANYWIESTGGTLNLAGAIPASTPGGARTITLRGDSPTIVSGTIQNGTGGGTVSLQKAGSGTVTLQSTNTFTGTLYVDSNSDTANDGVLKLRSSSAVASAASPILIRNNTAGSSTFQLDGSSGNVTVPQAITLSGRNNTVPAIQNLTGSNTLAGGVTITVGGSDYRFQADAGTLTLGGTVAAASAGGSRNLTFQGAGSFNVSANIQNGSATLGVIKTNTGRLTFSGNNTYSGPTIVAGGTLALTGTLANSSNILVSSSARFDVSQTAGIFTLGAAQTLSGSGVVTGAVVAASGSRLSPGTSAGTLTFANSLSLAGGATNSFELSTNLAVGGGINDLIVVAGDLNLSGTNVLALTPVNGKLSSGRYKLIQYSGALTGGATNFSIAWVGFPPVAAVALDDTVPGEIALVVTFNPQSLVWQGDGAANLWDIGTSSNWLAGVSNAVFFPGDDVTFDDSSANRTVALSLSLVPSSIAVNSSGNYTFTGSGKITGATGLDKSGTGTLTLLTTNDYSGPTTINTGTLQVGNGTTVGTLGTGPIFNDGTLLFNHSTALTNANPISGAGALAKSGAGTLNVIGANTYSGGTVVSGGIINLSANNGLGTGPLLVTNAGQQVTIVAGSAFTNDIVIGGPVGIVGTGIIKGPASGAATLSGTITFSVITPNGGTTTNGGAFDGGNASGGLIVTGPMTSLAGGGVHLRANRAVFSGGGDYGWFSTRVQPCLARRTVWPPMPCWKSARPRRQLSTSPGSVKP